MASLLTATGFQNRLYYLGLFFVFSGVVSYFLYLKEPSIQENLERRAFQLNYSALKNSIRLFNYRYILKQAESGNLNAAHISINGLAFNSAGYPIGESKAKPTQESPIFAENCRQIWQSVLGPLQPALSSKYSQNGYWVELSIENYCIFRHGQISDLAIEYNAVKGLVSLSVINR